MEDFDDCDFDCPPSPVYGRREVEEMLEKRVTNALKKTDQSGMIMKLQNNNDLLAEKLKKLDLLESENEKLKNKLSMVSSQLESTSTQVTKFKPISDDYDRKKAAQIKTLENFIKHNCVIRPGAKLNAKDLNKRLFNYTHKLSEPISQHEVKGLMTNPPFNFVSSKSSGIIVYRDLEFAPVQDK